MHFSFVPIMSAFLITVRDESLSSSSTARVTANGEENPKKEGKYINNAAKRISQSNDLARGAVHSSYRLRLYFASFRPTLPVFVLLLAVM